MNACYLRVVLEYGICVALPFDLRVLDLSHALHVFGEVALEGRVDGRVIHGDDVGDF